jgi:5-methylcytosine-specific restriction enzyme subunit McrC
MTVTVLDLQEGCRCAFAAEALPIQAATAINSTGRFEIEWPSPVNDGKTVVTPRDWVGHIPITPDLMVRVTPKVSVPRLFDLLEVAYNLRSFRLFEGETEIESVEGLIARIVSILAMRVLGRARQGLYG